jgi:hypothetical protein
MSRTILRKSANYADCGSRTRAAVAVDLLRCGPQPTAWCYPVGRWGAAVPLAGSHRPERLPVVQRLDLVRLVGARRQGRVRGMKVEPHAVPALLRAEGISREQARLGPVRGAPGHGSSRRPSSRVAQVTVIRARSAVGRVVLRREAQRSWFACSLWLSVTGGRGRPFRIGVLLVLTVPLWED